MRRKLIETLRRLLPGTLTRQSPDSRSEIIMPLDSERSDAAALKRKLVFLVDGTGDRGADSRRLARQMRVFGLDVAIVLLNESVGENEYRAIATTHVVDGGAGALGIVASGLAAQGYGWAIGWEEIAGACRPVLEAAGFLFKEIPDLSSQSEFAQVAFGILRDFDPSLKSVSVVVPNFNYAAYLDGRLSSIFAQSYPIFEIIVLDDASTDDSLAALGRIRDGSGRSFRLIANDRNSGSVFKQWSKGLDLASGELVWIAEADDFAEPHFVERLAAEFSDPALNMAFANSRQVDEKTAPLAESYDFYYRLHLPGLMSDVKLPGREFLQRFLGVRNAVFNVSSVIFRRVSLMLAVRASSVDFSLLHVAGDWNVYIEICRQEGFIAYLADPLNVHRRHLASVTLSLDFWRHIAEIIVIHHKVSAMLGAENPFGGQAAYIEELMVQLSLSPRAGKSPGATALLRWLDDFDKDPDLLRLALERAPADLIDECLADIPPEYPAARAALTRQA